MNFLRRIRPYKKLIFLSRFIWVNHSGTTGCETIIIIPDSIVKVPFSLGFTSKESCSLKHCFWPFELISDFPLWIWFDFLKMRRNSTHQLIKPDFCVIKADLMFTRFQHLNFHLMIFVKNELRTFIHFIKPIGENKRIWLDCVLVQLFEVIWELISLKNHNYKVSGQPP